MWFFLRWTAWSALAGLIGAFLGIVTLVLMLDSYKSSPPRSALMITATFLGLHFLPAAVFAAAVAWVQRRLIAGILFVGASWTGASAIGAGIGALLGLRLILTGAARSLFGSAVYPASLSVGIGLGLGVAQWLHLRRTLRGASLWIAAYPLGLLAGVLLAEVAVRAMPGDPAVILFAPVGALGWVVASILSGGVLSYMRVSSGRS